MDIFILKLIGVYTLFYSAVNCILYIANMKEVYIYIIDVFFVIILFCSEYKNRKTPSYFRFCDLFRKSFWIIAGVFIVALINNKLYLFSKVSIPFFTVYVINNIMLLRVLRLQKFNIKYSPKYSIILVYEAITLFTISLVFTIDYIRNLFFKGIYSLIYFVYKIIFSVLGVILYLLSFIVQFLGKIFKFNISGRNININIPSPNIENINKGSSYSPYNWNIKYINIFLDISFIIIILITVIVIYRKFHKESLEEEEFVENREWISGINERVNKKNSKGKVGPVRECYKKFLILCRKRKIICGRNDTTLDINNKAKAAFNSATVDEIREIYIKNRYSKDYKCTEDDISKISNNIKSIKRQI